MTGADNPRPEPVEGAAPQFTYVEELVRHELSKSLGGARGMLEGAAPFVGFTIVWVISRSLPISLLAALGVAVDLRRRSGSPSGSHCASSCRP